MNQRLGAATSVVLGIVVSVLTNLVTSGPTVPLITGFVAAAVLWVALTALHQPGSSPPPAPTAQTHGAHSPIIHADNNSGTIGINTPPSTAEEPDADGNTTP
ncbi:hypothetical protein OR263_17390 [Streptomyces sp. NEAU-H22]|uniref:hypothetical protein n=1 Tax=unclassified Streptomyces TaxID=2593676 RepID=UPI00225A069B|nr:MULTISPECIES: hypothetical protein [unclassified Streptomyces]MCX3288457.1 hypothetical protein [Streptomyces sp. NEAU-H22]WMD08398.1 hypothetical protein Q7C01_30260 [Streptomyces sp. FXY-T5]